MSTSSTAADFCRTSGSSFHHHKLLLSTGSYPGSVCIRNCCRPAGADWYPERGSAEDRIPTRRTAVAHYSSTLKKIWNSRSILIRQRIVFLSVFHKNGKVDDIVTKAFLASYFGKDMKSSYWYDTILSRYNLFKKTFFWKMKWEISLQPMHRKDLNVLPKELRLNRRPLWTRGYSLVRWWAR